MKNAVVAERRLPTVECRTPTVMGRSPDAIGTVSSLWQEREEQRRCKNDFRTEAIPCGS